jgi:hypothetical protein
VREHLNEPQAEKVNGTGMAAAGCCGTGKEKRLGRNPSEPFE